MDITEDSRKSIEKQAEAIDELIYRLSQNRYKHWDLYRFQHNNIFNDFASLQERTKASHKQSV